jgi:O-antigen ligase
MFNPMTRAMFEGVSKVESSFSYMSRLNFYEDAWKIFLENPITGVGFGNLGFYSMFKFTKAVASAHNIVLGMLGETGLVGALLFMSLIIYSLTACFKNYIKETNEKNKILLWSFISAFLGVLVNSMIEPNFEGWQFSMIFWASIAVFLSVGNLSNDKNLTSDKNPSIAK